MKTESEKKCPLYKECHASCFGTMLDYCFSRNGKSPNECWTYQAHIAEKAGVEVK